MKLGIDFGSTYSTISSYDENNDTVSALRMSQGAPECIPSVVSISSKGKGNVSCGLSAKDQLGKKTALNFEAFKMLLTEKDSKILAQRGYDTLFTPREITKLYLTSLLKGVQNRYGCDSFEEIYICVPEIWGKSIYTLDGRSILQEILYKDTQMDIRHVRVVTEPEAASAFFAYNYEKETAEAFNGHILLIDYGGGTLDLTLTQVVSNGQGQMEITYREGGGAGENHPDANGQGVIGSAGFSYMQAVVEEALRAQGMLKDGEHPKYTAPDFAAAVRDLESKLKSAEGMQSIADTFEQYGTYYSDFAEIMRDDRINDEDKVFHTLEYADEEIDVTYQQLYSVYQRVIAPTLQHEIEKINERTKDYLNLDPTNPEMSVKDSFKIAVVGGFGSFFLVNRQIAEIYRFNHNLSLDKRIKNIPTDKRELAISMGAALLAAGRVVLHKTARYSIGLYTEAGGIKNLHYGIHFHQTIVPGQPYFICHKGSADDSEPNRIVFGALYGNIEHFAIEFSNREDCGGLMAIKQEILQRLEKLPVEGFWNCGFSVDESDIVTFHVVPRLLPGFPATSKGISIRLESYSNMFDLTAVKEVQV